MSWRAATSLLVLRDQINGQWPNRNKASDGLVGDSLHAAVASDHNPNPNGVVCALDLTHDPANGFDAHATADIMLTNRHPDLKYLISNRRIAGAWTNWQWRSYSGTADPHVNHIHVSVGVGPDGQSQPPYDDEMQWVIKKEEYDVIENEEMAVKLGRMLRPNSGATADEARVWVGQRYRDVINAMMNEVYKRDEDIAKNADDKNQLIVTLQTENNKLIQQLKDQQDTTAKAVQAATMTAPSATKASWFSKLKAALGIK